MNNENATCCSICPRHCKVDRNIESGFCKEKNKIRIAKIIDNFEWEEPCITGKKGCLAIFFSGCNLRCDYCQNYEISRGGIGKTYTIDEFCKLIEQHQKKNSYIDLITPTHFAPQLCDAFSKINKKIPVVWNTNSYEQIETIEKVSRFVDIFLADLKYSDNKLAQEFSKCVDYVENSVSAIKTMAELKQDIFDGEEMKQGVIIRHLVLPNHISNSTGVLDIIKDNFSDKTLSLMSQFTPNGKSKLNRRLKPIEYKAVLVHMQKLNLSKGYIQEFDSASESFVPNFV